MKVNAKNIEIELKSDENQWKIKAYILNTLGNCLKQMAKGWNRLENCLKRMAKFKGWNRLKTCLKTNGKRMKHILGYLISKCVHFSLQIGIGHPGRPFPGKVNYRKKEIVGQPVRSRLRTNGRKNWRKPMPKWMKLNWNKKWKSYSKRVLVGSVTVWIRTVEMADSGRCTVTLIRLG